MAVPPTPRRLARTVSPWVRGAVLLLLMGTVLAQWQLRSLREARGTLVLTAPDARPSLPVLPPDETTERVSISLDARRALAQLTHDDLARGIWALAQLPGDHPLMLTAAQREELVHGVEAGARLRAGIETQRDAARAERRRWQAAHHRVLRALGTRALSAARPERPI